MMQFLARLRRQSDTTVDVAGDEGDEAILRLKSLLTAVETSEAATIAAPPGTATPASSEWRDAEGKTGCDVLVEMLAQLKDLKMVEKGGAARTIASEMMKEDPRYFQVPVPDLQDDEEMPTQEIIHFGRYQGHTVAKLAILFAEDGSAGPTSQR